MDHKPDSSIWFRFAFSAFLMAIFAPAYLLRRADLILIGPIALGIFLVVGLMIRFAYFIGRDPPPDPPGLSNRPPGAP